MMKNNITDEQLIKQFQEGDRQSYNELVFRYKDKILNFLYRFVYDMDLAEDLAQETFLKVYLKKDSYREISKFSTSRALLVIKSFLGATSSPISIFIMF